MPLERRQTEIKSLRELVAFLQKNPNVCMRFYRKRLSFEVPRTASRLVFRGVHDAHYLHFVNETCETVGETILVCLGLGMRFEWALRFFPGGFRYRFDDVVLTFFFDRSDS